MSSFAKIYFFCLFISLQFMVAAQNFKTIDKRSMEAPKATQSTVEKLASYLNEGTSNDLEKVRAYYVWLGHNIAYDTKIFFSNNPNPKTSAPDVLKSKKAICQGYAELFKALCDISNLPCEIVGGYSKGYGYTPDKKITSSDHAWNIVFVQNNWQLIDATWGSGYVDNKRQFQKSFTDEYFLASPETFILKHLPADPMWQLIKCPITITDYQKSDDKLKATLANCTGNFNFNDTITAYLKLNKIDQQMQSADRAYRFNPDNVEAPGFALLTLSYDKGGELTQMYNEKNYTEALRLNKEILQINEKALTFLRKSKNPQSKNAVDICKQNIESSKENIKSLEKFMKN